MYKIIVFTHQDFVQIYILSVSINSPLLAKHNYPMVLEQQILTQELHRDRSSGGGRKVRPEITA